MATTSTVAPAPLAAAVSASSATEGATSGGVALGIVWIVGIICAIVAVLGLGAVGVWWLCLRKTTSTLEQAQMTNVNAARSSNDLALDVGKGKRDLEQALGKDGLKGDGVKGVAS